LPLGIVIIVPRGFMANKPDWKKLIIIGVLATITPGGFLVLGALGLKKLLKKKKDQ